MRTQPTKSSLILGISIFMSAVVLSVGISQAAGTTIKACAKKSNGAMRFIDSNKSCKKSERTLTWGSQGETGATGATGSTGATGATGAPGPSNAYFSQTATPEPVVDDGSPYRITVIDNLPAGNYILNTSLNLRSTLDTDRASCRLFIYVAPYSFYSSQFMYFNFTSIAQNISQSLTYSVKDLPGGSYDLVELQCYSDQGRIDVRSAYITALKVESLEEQ